MKKGNKKEQLIDNLKGVKGIKSNGGITVGIHPCSGCDCGGVLVSLTREEDELPSFYSSINDQFGLRGATAVFNQLNHFDDTPMTEVNFLTFLNMVFDVDNLLITKTK